VPLPPAQSAFVFDPASFTPASFGFGGEDIEMKEAESLARPLAARVHEADEGGSDTENNHDRGYRATSRAEGSDAGETQDAKSETGIKGLGRRIARGGLQRVNKRRVMEAARRQRDETESEGEEVSPLLLDAALRC
jgi:hypothetical protein